MSKHRLTFVFVLTLILATSLFAESSTPQTSIPFDFVVGGVTFPAGTYTVSGTSSSNFVLLRNTTNPKAICLVKLSEPRSSESGRMELVVKRAPVKISANAAQK